MFKKPLQSAAPAARSSEPGHEAGLIAELNELVLHVLDFPFGTLLKREGAARDGHDKHPFTITQLSLKAERTSRMSAKKVCIAIEALLCYE